MKLRIKPFAEYILGNDITIDRAKLFIKINQESDIVITKDEDSILLEIFVIRKDAQNNG